MNELPQVCIRVRIFVEVWSSECRVVVRLRRSFTPTMHDCDKLYHIFAAVLFIVGGSFLEL